MQSLSIAIRGAEEDTTILFTQFIKLLLNDANYLLDEALHNLEEVQSLLCYLEKRKYFLNPTQRA